MRSLIIIILASYAVKCDDDASYYVIEIPEESLKEPKPFRVYWNVPTMQCKSKRIPFENLHEKFGIIQNTGDSFRGDEIAILYDPGIFPALLKNETSGKYRFRNGGVPQEGDLERHWNAFRKVLDRSIPDPDFSGIGIIDFESWRPIFRQNFGVLAPYKDFSIKIEKKQHWFWPEKAIEARAKQRFEEAARSFMHTTLVIAKELRPFAQWGYYAYPYCFNMSPNSPVETCTTTVREENDKINWLWQESTALYPSTYFSRGVPAADMARTVRGRVAEAARLRRSAPILPYFWYRYRDGGFLPQKELETILETIYNSTASGFIIWGSSTDVKTVDKCKKLLKYTEEVLGPAIAKYTKLHDANLNKVRPVTSPSESGITTWRPILRDQLSNNQTNSLDQNSTHNWFALHNNTQETTHKVERETNKTNNISNEDKYLLHIKRNTLLELLFNILLYKEMSEENNESIDYDQNDALPQISSSEKTSDAFTTESTSPNANVTVSNNEQTITNVTLSMAGYTTIDPLVSTAKKDIIIENENDGSTFTTESTSPNANVTVNHNEQTITYVTSSMAGYTTMDPLVSTAKKDIIIENENDGSDLKENVTQYVDQNYNITLYASEFSMPNGDEKFKMSASMTKYSTVDPLNNVSTNADQFKNITRVKTPIICNNLVTAVKNKTDPSSEKSVTDFITESSSKIYKTSSQTYDTTLNTSSGSNTFNTESISKLDETSTQITLGLPSTTTNNNSYVESSSEITLTLMSKIIPTTDSNVKIESTGKDVINGHETVPNLIKTTLYDIEDEINKDSYPTKSEKKVYHEGGCGDHFSSINSIIMPKNNEETIVNTSTLPKSKDEKKGHHTDNGEPVSSTEAIITASTNGESTSKLLLHQTLDDNETQNDENTDSTLPPDFDPSTDSIIMLLKEDDGKFPLLLAKDEKEGHDVDNGESLSSTENTISFVKEDDSMAYVIAPINSGWTSQFPLQTKDEKESLPITNVNSMFSTDSSIKEDDSTYITASLNSDLTSQFPLHTKDERESLPIENVNSIFSTDSFVIPLSNTESENDHISDDRISSTNTSIISLNDETTTEFSTSTSSDSDIEDSHLTTTTGFITVSTLNNEITSKDSLIESVNENNIQDMIETTNIVSSTNSIGFSLIESLNKNDIQNVIDTTDAVSTTNSIAFSSDAFPSKQILLLPKVTIEHEDDTDSFAFEDQPKIIAIVDDSTESEVKSEETNDNGGDTYEESEVGDDGLLSPVNIILIRSINSKIHNSPKIRKDVSVIGIIKDTSESSTIKNINNTENHPSNEITPTEVLSTESVRLQ